MSSTTTSTIGDSDVKFDIHELRKRIDPVIRDQHSILHFPTYRDYDRHIKYSLTSIGRWLLRTPTPKRIYTRKDRSFIFCKHTTFDNLNDIQPASQRKRIATSYRLSRTSRRFPPFYSLAYHTEYGNTSFWRVSHLTDIITQKEFAHGLSMSVMMNGETRRPQKVIPAIRAICDNNWINEYPEQYKPRYRLMKTHVLDNMNVLNELKLNLNKKLIYSFPIQMRYRDEDQNQHLNTHTYSRYAYECLMMYDKSLRNNQSVLYWTTNIFWKELRMQNFNHCYVNIWDIKVNKNENMTIYIGTIDIDETICKRDKDKIILNNSNTQNRQWIHYNGFMAGVVNVNNQRSKL